MLGMMQDWPLVVPSILDHAARFHGEREIVTRSVEGPVVRSTYAKVHSRSRQVAKALTRRIASSSGTSPSKNLSWRAAGMKRMV